jgi:acetyl esterase
MLHPQAQAMLDQVEASGMPPLYAQSIAELREIYAAVSAMVGEGAEMFESRALAIPVAGGELVAGLQRPVAEPAGVLVYFHGGGFVIGSTADLEASLQLLAAASGCDVVGVDYRLAPEHPYPAAVEDAYEACLWIERHLANGRPIVVAGDSAGGTLAAVTALRARDRGELSIAAQVLIYPVTDGRMETESYETYGDAGLMLGRREMERYWSLYAHPRDRLAPDASPLLAASHADLPPALVVIAEYDPLRDEGRAYAEAMRAAGVAVEVTEYDDVFHGFATMPNVIERGNEAIDACGKFARAQVALRREI